MKRSIYVLLITLILLNGFIFFSSIGQQKTKQNEEVNYQLLSANYEDKQGLQHSALFRINTKTGETNILEYIYPKSRNW